MLSKTDRTLVERIRQARTIKIIVNENYDDEVTIEAKHQVKGISRLAHETAIAWQNYLNQENSDIR